MAVANGYTTLANIKGLKLITSTNAADDAVIERLIGAASRIIDGRTFRAFFPRIETKSYDIPEGGDALLFLGDDLLSLTALTNGDGTTFASDQYVLESANRPPYWGIRLKANSEDWWELDADSSDQRVIDVLGEWGYHDDQARRWLAGSPLNEPGNLNASDLTFTATSGTLFSQGQVIKIDSEIMNVSGVATNDLTVTKRGDNGSTAATHANGATIYVWQPIQDIVAACEDIVLTAYNKRFGSGQESGEATITAAGVVIAPRDITEFARSICERYKRVA